MKTEKIRIARKLYEWMWFFISMLPFIVGLLGFTTNAYGPESDPTTLGIVEDYFVGVKTFIADYGVPTIYAFFGDVFLNYGIQIGSQSYDILCGSYLTITHIISWFATVEILRLVFDLVMWVPRFLQKQLNKGVK